MGVCMDGLMFACASYNTVLRFLSHQRLGCVSFQSFVLAAGGIHHVVPHHVVPPILFSYVVHRRSRND